MSQSAHKSNTQFTQQDLVSLLPCVLSDMKLHFDHTRQSPTNKNIRRDMYRKVVLAMGDAERFGVCEKAEFGVEVQIKGYTRDVWAYLHDAYDLVHDTDFESKFADVIQSEYGADAVNEDSSR